MYQLFLPDCRKSLTTCKSLKVRQKAADSAVHNVNFTFRTVHSVNFVSNVSCLEERHKESKTLDSRAARVLRENAISGAHLLETVPITKREQRERLIKSEG